ncbi:hypothetical protein [Aeromonas sp. sif0611]|uniref:hypothetical protein n=1 Tax=Aeromonas sp. sif0611 TaxID=2854787 RepID=UPI001C463362|nr:hypothetical protein [Aeromonas sp. sif0611]MBV7468338.1 hypothetical protein [Aeromonas sp. sif0611]
MTQIAIVKLKFLDVTLTVSDYAGVISFKDYDHTIELCTPIQNLKYDEDHTLSRIHVSEKDGWSLKIDKADCEKIMSYIYCQLQAIEHKKISDKKQTLPYLSVGNNKDY